VTGYSWDSAGECSFSGIENGVITCQTTQLSLIDAEPDKDVRGKLSQKKVKTHEYSQHKILWNFI